jgi:tetratricopeptide (TPR) repeat protein
MRNNVEKYVVIISVGLLLATANVGCSSGPSPELVAAEPMKSKAEIVNLAKVEQQSNRLDKAIFYYIQALEIDNRDVDVLYQIGMLQNRLHNPELAVNAFEKGLEINPDYAPALLQMGIYYLEQKMIDKSKIYLKHTVFLDQKRLLNTNVSKGLVPLDHHSPLLAYNVYAVVNDLESQHDYAREIFALLLEIQQDSPLVYTNLGYSHYLTNHYNLAQQNYKKALDIDPNFERAKLNLGLIYVRTGQYNRAIRLFKQVMTDAQAFNDIGYFLMLEGRYKEAEYFLQSAIDLSPSYFKKGNINLENVHLYLSEASILDNER